MRKIILASSSRQRKNILSALNIPFDVVAADIDEKTIRDPDPEKQAEKIARAKAEKIAAGKPDAIVIAGDTFSVLDSHILEKPGNAAEAKAMLRLLSGKTAVNYNGFCYIDRSRDIDYSTTAVVKFAFRVMDEMEIENYVAKLPVTEWAAAFSPAYPYPMTVIARVEGSLTGFTHGLPMELVVEYLKKSEVAIKP